MTYVLISLPGDEAAREADELAEWFSTRRAPAARFREVAPNHDAVRKAIAATPTVLVFGHDGGGALRAASGGEVWADAAALGRMCPNARVYAFACNTMGAHSADAVQGLGVDAVAAGVEVFAGFSSYVPAGTGLDPKCRNEQAVRAAIGQVLVGFLDGCSDQAQLRLMAERSFSIVDGRFRVLGGAPAAIRSAMANLRVVQRPAR